MMTTTRYRLTFWRRGFADSRNYKTERHARTLFDQADIGTMRGQVTGARLSEVETETRVGVERTHDTAWDTVVITRTRTLATKGEVP
jgi:hypothetical protein